MIVCHIFSMFVKPEVGLLYFNLYKSTHLPNAYKCGKEIVVSIEFSNCTSYEIYIDM